MRIDEEDNRTEPEESRGRDAHRVSEPVPSAVSRAASAHHGFVWSKAIKTWIAPVLLGVVGFVIVHPFDAPLAQGAARLAGSLSGDVRRELHAWQQYGQGLSLAVIALAIWLADPGRRRRLLDLGAAAGIAEAVSHGGKVLVGRPRPRPEFADARTFLGPWGEYPVVVHGKPALVHAWDTGAGATTDLWSMPSSHTLLAATMSVFLAALYPRLRWLLVGLTVLVGMGRVLFDAHWPTDVVVGGAAGYAIGAAATWNYWGVRAVDWVWRVTVDRSAAPALPRVVAVERARGGGTI